MTGTGDCRIEKRPLRIYQVVEHGLATREISPDIDVSRDIAQGLSLWKEFSVSVGTNRSSCIMLSLKKRTNRLGEQVGQGNQINHQSCQSGILDNFPLLSIPALIIISLRRTLYLVFLPLFPPTLIHPALSCQLHEYLTPLYKTYHYFPVASKKKPKLLGNAAKTLHDLPSTYFSSLFCRGYLVSKSWPTLL